VIKLFKISFIPLALTLVFFYPTLTWGDIILYQEITSSPAEAENNKKPQLEEREDEEVGTLRDLEDELKDLNQKLSRAKNEAQKKRINQDIRELEQLLAESKQGMALSPAPGEPVSAKEQITIYISGNKLRFDTGPIVSIIDMDRKVILNLSPQGKAYHEITFEEWEKMQKQAEQAMAKMLADKQKNLIPRDVKVTRTENKQKINNFNCEQYTVTDPMGSDEVWVTKDVDFKEYNDLMKRYSEMMMQGNPDVQRELEKLQIIEGIPVKVISKSPYSVETTEVKKVSTEKIDPILFQVPKDFKKFVPGRKNERSR
jgi:hypothetical protein